MTTTVNAKLVAAYLGGWDDSVPSKQLVVSLTFEGDGWGQGSGHYSGEIEKFVVSVLQALEISEWAKLPKTLCRVRRNDRGMLVAVGHFMKDQWFTFADL